MKIKTLKVTLQFPIVSVVIQLGSGEPPWLKQVKVNAGTYYIVYDGPTNGYGLPDPGPDLPIPEECTNLWKELLRRNDGPLIDSGHVQPVGMARDIPDTWEYLFKAEEFDEKIWNTPLWDVFHPGS